MGDPTGKSEKASAERQLAAVQAQWTTINLITTTLRAERQENHFAERLRIAFREDQ